MRIGDSRGWWPKKSWSSRPWTRSLKKSSEPGQKRQVVRQLRQADLPLRVALALVHLARATYYRRLRGRWDTEELKERIRELALGHASFGYRRITAVLRRQGWRVNPKRVYRLYRQMDLQRPTRRKGRRGAKHPVAFRPSEAQAPGQVWAVDFIEDKLVSGRRLRILSVLDLCSRYALDSLVEHSLTGELAARHLERLFLSHGALAFGGNQIVNVRPVFLGGSLVNGHVGISPDFLARSCLNDRGR